ncbi:MULTISPECIES: sulfurtransferase [Microbacterium]|uniref:sulfurtransferase n=1 Tax=Microbacterium TaxID=33882 RepID=UPI0011EA778F|nr:MULTISPECIES: sulfurtransferase [Microbacterium]
MSHFLSATDLHDLIDEGAAIRIIDVRWRLDRPEAGHSDYLSGHIPGAVFASLDQELSTPGAPTEGRHPLPSRETLEAAARRWGVRQGDAVVAYDDTRGLAAARAWWLLRQAGVDVRVLDGGLRAWTAAGYDLTTDDVVPEMGDVELSTPGQEALSIDEAATFPARGVLLDVRAPERYRGESEPLDPVAGHIPGARNLPTLRHLDEHGRLRDRDSVLATLAEAGIAEDTPVAAYCGSGITAAHTALVLHEVGIPAKVYPGSWSQWSNTPGRPVATGDQPG